MKIQTIYRSSRLGIVDKPKALDLVNGVYLFKLGTGYKYELIRGKKQFELTNHLGNVLATISDKKIPVSADGRTIDYYLPDLVTATFYSSYGASVNGYNFEKQVNAFNGQRRSPEISSTAQTAQYWEYDSRIGRRWNVDPLASKFPWQSPYTAMDDNPINIIDPDGQSGEPVIDKKNKTITVSQHLVFYGGKAETKLSNKIATGVAAQWNGAHGKVVVDGVKYKVNFKVTYETVTDAEATKMASGNTDIKNNFIRVEDGTGSSFTQKLGANSYYFNTDDDIGGSTTPAHEIGHGLGLDHTATGGQTKTDVPDIMEARGTQVNPRWSKVGPSNDIDPNFRRVDKKEVEAIFKGVTFDKNGKGKIGTTTNKIYDKNGN